MKRRDLIRFGALAALAPKAALAAPVPRPRYRLRIPFAPGLDPVDWYLDKMGELDGIWWPWTWGSTTTVEGNRGLIEAFILAHGKEGSHEAK